MPISGKLPNAYRLFTVLAVNNFPPAWQVPHFTQAVYREKAHPYCLIIPVYNEGERIRRQLEKTSALGIDRAVDVIIADGGSTDGALEEDFLRNNAVSALLVKQDRGRLSAQLRMAYAWALARGYEGIVTIDGNNKDSVESIPLFCQALDAGVDYAQASRFIKGGRNINTPLSRMLAIRLIHAPVISLAARHWFTDTTQGFRAYSRRYLMDERVQPFRECFMDYELLAYLSARATRLGFRAMEIPTTRTYPPDGNVPTKISSFNGHINLVKVLYHTLTGHYNP